MDFRFDHPGDAIPPRFRAQGFTFGWIGGVLRLRDHRFHREIAATPAERADLDQVVSRYLISSPGNALTLGETVFFELEQTYSGEGVRTTDVLFFRIHPAEDGALGFVLTVHHTHHSLLIFAHRKEVI